MLWITCPTCGARPVEEYRFGGELPTVPEHVRDPDARNIDYAWYYDNPDGLTTERWFHSAGCRRWLTVRRDAHLDVIVDE
jgi:sarcosine oxidase, subunit delta